MSLYSDLRDQPSPARGACARAKLPVSLRQRLLAAQVQGPLALCAPACHRALLRRLHALFPALPLFGLVDWNPAGVSILCSYRFGGPRMGLEAGRRVLGS